MQISIAVMRSLAIVAIIAITVCTATDDKKISPCCVAASRAVVKEPIIDFKLQLKSLPCIRAIILVTAEKQYCIDPRQSWARLKINELLKSRRNSTVTPTSMSPSLTSTMPQNSTDSN